MCCSMYAIQVDPNMGAIRVPINRFAGVYLENLLCGTQWFYTLLVGSTSFCWPTKYLRVREFGNIFGNSIEGHLKVYIYGRYSMCTENNLKIQFNSAIKF